MTTKKDFTVCGATLYIALSGLLILNIFYMFTKIPMLNIIICSVGLVIYGTYLAYDT